MHYEKIYLIHEDDYLAHINDKVDLLIMLQKLVNYVKKSPIAVKDKELDAFASHVDTLSFDMFRGWDIPVEYLFSRDAEDLSDLMDSELLLPDDAEDDDDNPENKTETAADSENTQISEEDMKDIVADAKEELKDLLKEIGILMTIIGVEKIEINQCRG